MFPITRLPWLATCLLLLPALAWADPADGIVGDWLVESGGAAVRIRRQGDLFDGIIVWQLHGFHGADDGPELSGKPATDIHNPDPKLRSRTIDGMRLLWDLHYDAEKQEWTGGRVYDSNDGHTFSCQMRLIDPDHLKLRGYFGISLLGGSSVWTRLSKLPP
jgi:uncharacterized protein (DUF2147 family)